MKIDKPPSHFLDEPYPTGLWYVDKNAELNEQLDRMSVKYDRLYADRDRWVKLAEWWRGMAYAGGYIMVAQTVVTGILFYRVLFP